MSSAKAESPLRDEKELLDEFLALTREQAELLAAEDIDGFNASLAKRQTLIVKIDAMRPRLEAAAKKSEGGLAPGGHFSSTLHEIRELNDRNRETLERLMAQLSDEIKQLNHSQKGLGGYGQRPVPYSSEFFDRKS